MYNMHSKIQLWENKMTFKKFFGKCVAFAPLVLFPLGAGVFAQNEGVEFKTAFQIAVFVYGILLATIHIHRLGHILADEE